MSEKRPPDGEKFRRGNMPQNGDPYFGSGPQQNHGGPYSGHPGQAGPDGAPVRHSDTPGHPQHQQNWGPGPGAGPYGSAPQQQWGGHNTPGYQGPGHGGPAFSGADGSMQYVPAEGARKKRKLWPFIVGGVGGFLLLILVIGGIVGAAGSHKGSAASDPTPTSSSDDSWASNLPSADPTAPTPPAAPADQPSETAAPAAPAAPAVPADFESALTKAGQYSEMMHMSKQGIYDQLTSQYGEQFSKEAAQYAIDNLHADYNANALAKAKEYQSEMAMSPAAIRQQLTSNYGEKFTPQEAEYAISHLNS